MGVKGGQATRKTPARSKPQVRLQLESLEDRRLLSCTAVNGDLVVTASAPETVVVTHQVVNNVGYYKVTENGVNHWFADAKLWDEKVIFHGSAGNDYFRNDTWLHAKAYGGKGTDTLIGGWNDDYLDGGDGSDHLFGRAGNDTIYGDDSAAAAGDDFISGGAGNDYIDGREGNDIIFGDADNDTLIGWTGNDRLYGGTGSDTLWGGEGDDYLDGGRDGSPDNLHGGGGCDTFVAEPYFIGWGLYNRDKPADLNSAEGDMVVWS
jgi:Ca2+-binding RTX toxin-like protein